MSPLDPAVSRDLLAALAAGPAETFAVLSRLFLALPGVRAVTYLSSAPAHGIIHRVGTSDPENFPLGAHDPIDSGAWCRRIYGDKRAIVGDTPALMAEFIPETDQLVAMGYGATLCQPILIGGDIRGTVNLLGAAGILTPALLADFEALLPLAALAFTFDLNKNLKQGDYHAHV